MELGQKLEPGSKDGQFCKPTSVAVLPSGDFFVADGYCNSRIIKYNKFGFKLFEWGQKMDGLSGVYYSNRHSAFIIFTLSLIIIVFFLFYTAWKDNDYLLYAIFFKMILNIRLIIQCVSSALKTVRLNKRLWLESYFQLYTKLCKLLFIPF